MPRSLLAALALVALAAHLGGAQSLTPAKEEATAPSSHLTFDLVFADDASGKLPTGLAWSPDGTRLAYRWDDGSGAAVWVVDIATGRREAVLGGNRKGLPEAIAKSPFRWMPDGTALLLTHGDDLYLYAIAAKKLHRLTETDAGEKAATPSPDGRSIAFVREHDLYVLDVASGDERRLTTDGEENVTLNGENDWVYGEEIWNRHPVGFWWSPDSRRIAYYRFDETPVATYPLVNFLPTYPRVELQKYPKAGTDNPRVRIGVADLASGRTTWMGTGDDPTAYLARVAWTPDGGRLAIQRLDRDQTHLDLLLCNPASGGCRTLLTESDRTWVNLGDDFRFLPDGRFLWGSERTGFRHLYLYDDAGHVIRDLTPGERAATLDAVLEAAGKVVYSTYGDGFLGAAERVVLSVGLAGGAPVALAGRPGWNTARVAPKTGHWVHTWTDADHVPQMEIVKADGSAGPDLPQAGPRGYDPGALPRWEIFTLPGPDGLELPARLLKPAGFDPARRYPVIMYHYGCPASQVVLDRWDGRNLWHKMMAERGYAVLEVDNGGSLFFGKHGEDHAYRRFGPGNLAAQLAAVEWLKEQPWVDPSRIGLWGWSGGGSNTLYALLNSPGTWKAGVAGAPVTDWHLYDTIWTERYLDRPQDNEEGYEKSSPVNYAANLEDRLLIIHGTADDNVHPQNTIVMSNALIGAGKMFEQAIYPRQKHGFVKGSLRHVYERITEFFDRTLQGREPSGAAAPR